MSDEKNPLEEEQNNDDAQKDLDDILGQITESENGRKKEVPEQKKIELPEAEPEVSLTDDSEESDSIESILEKISEKDDAGAESAEPVEELGLLQRVVGIFFGPSNVFRYLKNKPDIWTPVIIVALLGIMASFLVYDFALDAQIEKYEQNDRLTEEQVNGIIDNIEAGRSGPRRYLSIFFFPILGTLVVISLLSLIFLMIGNVFLGGKSSFKQVMSAFGYSYLILSLAGTIVKLPIMVMQKTIEVDTSLAVFLPLSFDGTAFARFLGACDIFVIWYLAVFSIGFGIIYRYSTKKAAIAVFSSWLLFVLIFNVALAGLFAKFF